MLVLHAQLLGQTKSFPLGRDAVEVVGGSLPDNAIYIPFRGVSRRHFSLAWRDEGWWLKDLQSTNGLYLNGVKVSEEAVRLRSGDKILAGTVALEVREEGSEPSHVSLPRTPPRTPSREETGGPWDSGAESEASPFVFPGLFFPEGMVLGRSPAIYAVYEHLHSVADSPVSLLIEGTTGVGKEMVARAVHLSSRRCAGPFVAVNCAAIPADLVEAELFGIGDRVATGVGERRGRFVQAHQGTLFLDEVNGFPLALQAKILRAIEEKAIVPLGTVQALPSDFRVIAATNESPAELLRSGRLREDLYHRLSGLTIRVPSLRERREDIAPFVMAFVQRYSIEERKPIAGVSKRLLAHLVAREYPGNVRELSNLARTLVALARPGETLDLRHLPHAGEAQPPEAGGGAEARLMAGPIVLKDETDAFIRHLTSKAIELSEGRVPEAARRLGLSPFGLRKMLKRLGPTAPSDEGESAG